MSFSQNVKVLITFIVTLLRPKKKKEEDLYLKRPLSIKKINMIL